jgi:UDP-glucose 4-epimerase
MKNNAEGMLEMMIKLMHKDKWPVLVYASTSETFGNPQKIPMNEDHVQRPQSIYAVSKLTAERILTCHTAWNKYPGSVVTTFNTYGPNQNSSFSDAAVIALFIKKSLCGDTITIHGDGNQTRDFQYVGDAIRAYLILGTTGFEDGTKHYAYKGREYNTGTGVQTSIKDLANTILSITKSTSDITHTEARTGDLEALEADYTKIRHELGWKPQTTLREGLEKTISWYRTQFLKKGVLPSCQDNKIENGYK